MNDFTQNQSADANHQAILHICKREILRPIRDQILRMSGYHVDSAPSDAEARAMLASRPYDLVLIDVEGENGVAEAEHLCSEIKQTSKDQVVAFVCNWRVAMLNTCPDDIVRTEFDPVAFATGVKDVLARH